jgi:hypothetical protein
VTDRYLFEPQPQPSFRPGPTWVTRESRFTLEVEVVPILGSGFAAAKEMHHALKRITELVHDYLGDQSAEDGWKNEEVREVWLQAMSAIKKAEGKQ